MPVLARTLEAKGLSTILVTGMPYWAEKVGVPRTLAIEFPFGHTLGLPNDVAVQRRVIQEALEVLKNAEAPGGIVHSQEEWPGPQREWMKRWQPSTPSPVIEHLAPRLREMLSESRLGGMIINTSCRGDWRRAYARVALSLAPVKSRWAQ